MKVLLYLAVVVCISSTTSTSNENSRSFSDENLSSTSDENQSSFSEENETSSASESVECELSYKYNLWIGDNVDEVHSINLHSECGIVFLDAMRHASKKKEQFAFELTSHPLFGGFVTQINGVANDDEA